MLKDRRQISGCLRCTDAGFQTCHCIEPPRAGVAQFRAPGVELWIHHHGNCDIGRTANLDPRESWESRADNGEWKPVQVGGLAHGGRTQCKTALPVAVADHGYRILAWDFILRGREGSASDRLDA